MSAAEAPARSMVETHTVAGNDGAAMAVTVLRAEASRGSSPPVLLVHGWGAARAVWAMVAERLHADGRTVVSMDLRGHGGSAVGRDPISVPRLGRDLATVVEALDLSHPIVVGHSGGGFAALSLAADDADLSCGRLGGLVLASTAAHDQRNSAGEVRMMGSRVFSFALRRRALGRRLLAGTMAPKPVPAWLELNRAMFAATPATVRATCFECTAEMDLRPRLAGLHLPSVVLAGELDQVVAPASGRALAEALRDSRFELLPGVGHMIPLEAPHAVVTAVRELTG